jgi:hypothetical protein
MLTTEVHSNIAGFTHQETIALTESAALSVAEQTNQNLTPSQRELLLWHWKLGHCGFAWVQSLAAKPRSKPDSNEETTPLLLTKAGKVSSCLAPLCAACQLAKQTIRTPRTENRSAKERHVLKRDDLLPGDRVSIDQYQSSLPGRLPHTKGKEAKKDQYNGGTLFADHATGFIHIRHQVSLSIAETARSKLSFERVAAQCGHKIKRYRADNAPFGKEGFKIHFEGQHVDLSGVGAHHQNGVAERSIKTVTRCFGSAFQSVYSLKSKRLLHSPHNRPHQYPHLSNTIQPWPLCRQ